jgi:hypothetical protein
MYVEWLQNAKGCKICFCCAIYVGWLQNAKGCRICSIAAKCKGLQFMFAIGNVCVFQKHAMTFFSHTSVQALPLPWHFSATPVINLSICHGIF